MSTINSDPRPLAVPPDRAVAQPARRALPDSPHAHEGRSGEPGARRAADPHAAPPASEPVSGKVYALKDGSGYVALASDGHYYKLEPGGGGVTYAAASGPVDTSMVDVTHGPVRRMPSTAGPHAAKAPPQDAHLPGRGDGDAAASRLHRTTPPPKGSTAGAAADPHPAGVPWVAHTGSEPVAPPAEGAHTHASHAAGPSGTEAAVAAARATHGLIVRHPGAALRSHAGVSAEAVASLLR